MCGSAWGSRPESQACGHWTLKRATPAAARGVHEGQEFGVGILRRLDLPIRCFTVTVKGLGQFRTRFTQRASMAGLSHQAGADSGPFCHPLAVPAATFRLISSYPQALASLGRFGRLAGIVTPTGGEVAFRRGVRIQQGCRDGRGSRRLRTTISGHVKRRACGGCGLAATTPSEVAIGASPSSAATLKAIRGLSPVG